MTLKKLYLKLKCWKEQRTCLIITWCDEKVTHEGTFYKWSYLRNDVPKFQPSLLNWQMDSTTGSNSSVCPDCETCLSRRARLFPASFKRGRWCGGQLLSAKFLPLLLPEPIFTSLFFLISSISSKNEGNRLAFLRRTGHVALRGCFFSPPSGRRRVSRCRVVCAPCALRCTVAQALFPRVSARE